MSDELRYVRYEEEGGLATITVNRPDKLNALNDEVLDELGDALAEAYLSEDVGVILLTGAGDKAFVAGADIEMLAQQGVVDGKQNSLIGQDVMESIEDGPKPVIAVVNGYALGGGLELALACDFRYASERAVFGLPEVGLGIIPGYGGTQRLPRLIGVGAAMELILTGDKIGADEAYRIGLVNRVCAPEALMGEARQTAAKILERGPVAVQFAKEAVRRGSRMSQPDGLSLEADLFGILSSTKDMKEGMRAFLEKRAPKFEGK